MHSFNGLHTVFILSRGQSLHVGVLITSVPLPILRPKNYQVLDYKLFLTTKKQTLGDAISRTIYITSYFYNRVELNSKFLFSINFEQCFSLNCKERRRSEFFLKQNVFITFLVIMRKKKLFAYYVRSKISQEKY